MCHSLIKYVLLNLNAWFFLISPLKKLYLLQSATITPTSTSQEIKNKLRLYIKMQVECLVTKASVSSTSQ